MIRVHVLRSLVGPLERREFLADDQGPKRLDELAELYRHEQWAPGARLAAIVNGSPPIPFEAFADTVLEPGDDLVLVPAVEGIGAVVGWLAFNVLIPALAGVAVAWAYQAIVGPPELGIEQGGAEEASPTYRWSGLQTSYSAGGRIPIVYGEHRVPGQVIAADIYEKGAGEDVLKLLLALSEGPIEQIAGVPMDPQTEWDALGKLYVPVQPNTDPAGIKVNGNEISVEDLRVYLRAGTDWQGAIPINRNVRTLYSQNLPLNASVVQSYTTQGDYVTSLGIRVRFDALYEQQGSALQAYEVKFGVRFRDKAKNGNFGPEQTFSVKRFSRGSFYFTFWVWPGLGSTEYEFAIRRLTPDDGSNTFSRATWVNVIEDEWIHQPLRYPNLALASIEIRATERVSGSTPTVTMPIRGRRLAWHNGSSWQDETFYDSGSNAWIGRNPAWILADFLTNSRYGLGRYVSRDDLDLESFTAWADYCDELVSDGDGGSHPRHHFDGVLDRALPAWEIVLRICRAGQAVPVVQGRTIKIKFEHPDSVSFPRPVRQLFTQANVADFSIQWQDRRARPNIIDAQILDEVDDYEQQIISVEDADAWGLNEPWRLDAEKVRRETVSLFGVTRAAHARRLVDFMHATNRLWTHTITFTAQVDSVACEVGDVIAVETDVARFHATESQAFRTTRAGSSATSVYLDEEIVLAPATSYELFIVKDDGEFETVTVTAAAGTYPADTAISFSSAGIDFNKGAVVALGQVDATVGLYVVTKIDLEESLRRRVVAIKYDEDAFASSSLFATGEGDYAPQVLNPAGDGAAEFPLVDMADFGERVVLAWDVTPERRGLRSRVYVRAVLENRDTTRDNLVPQEWERAWEGAGSQASLEQLVAGQRYQIAVVFEDVRGNFGAPEAGVVLDVTPEEFPKTSPKPAPIVASSRRAQGFELAWSPTRQDSTAEYEVRRGPTWSGAERVAVVDRPSVHLERAPYGFGQLYQVRPRNRGGLYSGPEILTVVDVLAPEELSLVCTHAEDQTTIGEGFTLTDCSTGSGDVLLELDAGKLAGTALSRVVDMGTAEVRWWSLLVDSWQEGPTLTVGAATFTAGSGEARWRTPYGREASWLYPGGDFDTLVGSADFKVDDPAYYVAGREGGIGEHTRAAVWIRFDEGPGWGEWIRGPWVGFRYAQRVQYKIQLDRVDLEHERRIGRLELAVAQ